MDVDAARRFALRVWQVKQGEVVAMTIHLGVRLGLYDVMQSAGFLTPEEIAEAAEVDARWTREWLRAQAAAELVDHEAGRFRLSDEAAAVLADDRGSPFYAGGVFAPGDPAAVASEIARAFRAGSGFAYDATGRHTTELTEAMNDPWARLLLVPMVLPAFDGLVERLRDGIDVVDVGCGAGGALAELAAAFPRSRFTGVDPSAHAIARAAERLDEVENVRLVEGTSEALEPASADLITAFDVLHDMARPDRALVELRRAIRDDGLVIVKDIRTADDFEAQRKNPVLAMMYGLSLMSCLPSGYGDDGDGMALGNQGLTPALLEDLATEAGFASVTVRDLEDPVNLYYELRP